MNAFTLKLRLAILESIFLGALVAIAATAGKEQMKIERTYYGPYYDRKKYTVTIGLWEHCQKAAYYGEYTIRSPIIGQRASKVSTFSCNNNLQKQQILF